MFTLSFCGCVVYMSVCVLVCAYVHDSTTVCFCIAVRILIFFSFEYQYLWLCINVCVCVCVCVYVCVNPCIHLSDSDDTLTLPSHKKYLLSIHKSPLIGFILRLVQTRCVAAHLLPMFLSTLVSSVLFPSVSVTSTTVGRSSDVLK